MYYSKTGFNNHKRNKAFFEKNDLGDFLHDVFGGTVADIIKTEMTSTRPAVNVIESKTDYRLELAVPGLTKEDISIKLEKSILKVSAEKKRALEEGEKITRKEYDFHSFKRSFQLPDKVDAKAIKATVKNGILVISLGKKKKEDARDINID